jgi:hypothetical protein
MCNRSIPSAKAKENYRSSQKADTDATWMPAMVFSLDTVKKHLQSCNHSTIKAIEKRGMPLLSTKNVSYMAVKGLSYI